ncbi:MAG: molybdopterin-dependent oxidoreductase [Deltaproteobacteria bacterium]|nr:molybdopterin-dependent oxidoreductase [Deltaproteobacteria bacterium]MDQ3296306.1 molybdopterin-dependent oxidoreductase [Myxococcota bacterium]
MEQRHSACPLDCPDLCGLTVSVENGRVVEVDGDTRGPLTAGFICGKVRKIADHLYGDDRVLAPLIRVGAKGAGQWRTASWDEALGVIVDRFAAIRAADGNEAILPYHYGGSNGWLTEGALATRFFRRLGASNLDRTFCAAATMAAVRGLYGVMPGVALEDYEHAKLIVLWGVNPSATSIHLVPVIERARAAGAKLVVVDPRRTPLARRADIHLPLRPGTDLPVALAVIHALFARGHADRPFLDAHATDVGELAIRAARWSITAAAAEAGIDARLLDKFIELYARKSPAVIRVGWGLERNRNGGSAAAAILALPAIAGKFGVRGGGYTMSNGDAKWTVGPDAAIDEPVPPTRSINMSELGRALAARTDPPIRGLFVYNCNPVATAPDQVAVIEQLSRDDLFVVVHEQVMTDTARLADVVLPATAFLEHRELRRGYGTMRMFDSPAVATPPGEARSNNELFGALLERFGLVRPGDAMTDEELVTRTFAASERGHELRTEISYRGVAFPPDGTRPLPFVEAFPGTSDGKIHLVPPALDAEAGGLYSYKGDPATTEYPLALISPALATQISSTFGQLRKAPAALELAPADATARGIKDGDRVRIWNAQGEVRCLVRISPDVRAGVCVLAKGLWRKHTENGLTANALIPQTFADLGGQAAYNDARVEVTKLE